MKIENLAPEFQNDIIAIESIPVIASIFEVVCRTTGMGFAAVARVTEDKWIACAVQDNINFGLKPGGELTLETTICNEIRQNHKPVLIDHVAEDPDFANHHTPAMYGFQSYVSIPIFKKDGSMFGTLCAIDPNPAKVKNAATESMFKLFAELISFHLHAVEDIATSQALFTEEQQTSEHREKFIAILGHDLRNPVSAISMGSQLILGGLPEKETKEIAGTIQRSSLRVTGLIEKMLDFARGRLGRGIVLSAKKTETLQATLQQIVSELQMAHPDSIIHSNLNMGSASVYCDENRLAQLLSNLLANAIVHGSSTKPIIVTADIIDNNLQLKVKNQGNPIPADKQKMLFKPFNRDMQSNKNGLGLGLYIASQIAKAHNGTLTVQSTEQETVFTMEIPVHNTGE